MGCDDSNTSFAISMGFLSLIITLWAIFGTGHSNTPSTPDPVLQAFGTWVLDKMSFYMIHPFALVTKILSTQWFYFAVGLIAMTQTWRIMGIIADIIDFFRKNKKSSIELQFPNEVSHE